MNHNNDLETKKIILLYQGEKKIRKLKSFDQQNYLFITGFVIFDLYITYGVKITCDVARKLRFDSVSAVLNCIQLCTCFGANVKKHEECQRERKANIHKKSFARARGVPLVCTRVQKQGKGP